MVLSGFYEVSGQGRNGTQLAETIIPERLIIAKDFVFVEISPSKREVRTEDHQVSLNRSPFSSPRFRVEDSKLYAWSFACHHLPETPQSRPDQNKTVLPNKVLDTDSMIAAHLIRLARNIPAF